MRRNPPNKIGRFLRIGLGGLLIVFFLACGISAVANLGLPKRSKVVDHNEVGRTAGTTPGYEPLPDLNDDHDFNDYNTRERFWC